MRNYRPTPTKEFVFIDVEKPDDPCLSSPHHLNHDTRAKESRKKRLLSAIKRDLQLHAAPLHIFNSADALKLVEKLETLQPAPPNSSVHSASVAALQLSQSVALIERFIVDQLPQGNSGDDLLAAWNCIVERSVRAEPLKRHARPRVVEQLRCRAEAACTSSGSQITVFLADNGSPEQRGISLIEKILTNGDSKVQLSGPQPKMPSKSPRARFMQPLSLGSPKQSSRAAASLSGGRLGEKEKPPSVSDVSSDIGSFDRLMQILGRGDQHLQSVELNNELERIRDDLKQMKGRVKLMTERLDVPDGTLPLLQPLEPHERNVSTPVKFRPAKHLMKFLTRIAGAAASGACDRAERCDRGGKAAANTRTRAAGFCFSS
jgi:hypothetical protein